MNSLQFNEIGKAYNFDIEDNLEGFLHSKGIEYPELFLDPYNLDIEKQTNPFDFYMMAAAVNIFKKVAYESCGDIAILVDDDADGYSSAAAMLKYILNTSTAKTTLVFHDDKSHGLTDSIMKKLDEIEYDLLIIPDSSSNDYKHQIKILEKGKKLIILDHHEIDDYEKIENIIKEYPDDYALVNNSIGKNGNVNKNFVGVGIVYQFCKAISINDYEHYVVTESLLDLVAMGQIGDASDIADYEIRNLVRRGLDLIISPLLGEVFKEKIINGEKISSKNLSFSIIPMANAVSRIGEELDKARLVDGLAGVYHVNDMVQVERKRKNKATGKMEKVTLEWSHYELILDELTKIKSKQDRTITKVVKKLYDNMFKSDVTIIEASEEEIEHRSLTGLLANRIASENETPTLILVDNGNGDLSGSARGFEKSMPDFREWCNNSGLFKLAQGHPNAFGVVIERDLLEKLKENLKNSSDEKGQIVYDVDKIYYNESNHGLVETINKHEDLFGGSLREPVYGYKNLVIGRDAISQRGSVVSFYHNGLEFVAYKQESGVIDDFMIDMGFEQFVTVDLVGSPSKNEWTGQVKHQIVLKDYVLNKGANEKTKVLESKSEDVWLDAEGELSF